ncbi:protein containing Shikimate dehydrogenase substrate binding protein, partial [mine drainage metagenome]
MNRSTQLVVTLTARNLAEARGELEEVVRAGADLVEVRLDRWEDAERRRVRELLPSPIPLLLTVRSRAEGGDGPDDPRDREMLRRSVADPDWAALDLEAARDPLPSTGAVAGSTRVWVSTHLVHGATGADLERELRRPFPPGAVRKIVVPATLSAGLNGVFARAQEAARSGITLLTTGPAGPLERAWAPRLGIPFVFASPPERPPGRADRRVEPAQLPVDRLRPFYAADPPAPLFAVLGRPIDHSWSPWIHHHWWEKESRTGLYLALEPDSPAEFAGLLPRLAEGGFRGVNVTAPYKLTAPEAATHIERSAETVGSANTLTFRGSEVRADNTDLTAVRRRLDELRATDAWGGSAWASSAPGGAGPIGRGGR